MPQQILLFRVFVGAPSDVDEALDVIRGQIEQWNRDHGPLSRARVEFTNWRTHSHPAAGDRPQAFLNKVVDKSDIVAGIFNTRFGSPTPCAGYSQSTLMNLNELKNSSASWARTRYITPTRT